MHVVSLTVDSRIMDVYDPDVYLDPSVQVYPITENDFQLIWESGRNGDWVYNIETHVVTYDPIPYPPPPNPPTGDMPTEIL